MSSDGTAYFSREKCTHASGEKHQRNYTCNACAKMKDNWLYLLKKTPDQADKTPSKHTNHRFLTEPQKKAKVLQLQKEKKKNYRRS